MTRKDYVAIALILAGDLATSNLQEKYKVRSITLSLADYFAKANASFDRERFYRAAGLNSGGSLPQPREWEVLRELNDAYAEGRIQNFPETAYKAHRSIAPYTCAHCGYKGRRGQEIGYQPCLPNPHKVICRSCLYRI